MTDRSVVVRLKADTSAFTAKMVAAGRTAETAFLASSKAAEKNRAALRTVGNAAGLMGAAAAAGVAIAVKSAADFDKAMSGVQSATHESTRNMGLLRAAALKAGADTAFSATEAAGGIENLAKAGVSTADILSGGLRGALNLAAAGQIEVADAAEYTATALTQFQLKGDQASHVADLLAAGAGKAQGEVGDMALALKYAGVPAANLGVSIEQTAGSIALFAKNGIIGEQAGTTLRGMIASLSSPSSLAANTMAELGISAFDAKGNFIGLDGVAGQLHDKLGNLTQAERANALGRIFGNEQLQGANVLYREGAKGVDVWTRKVNDAGYAAETASIKQDNLAGDLEKLKGAFDTLLIGTGEGAMTPLRGITQGATAAVDALNALPGPVKTATLAFGGLVAVTGGAAFLGSRFIGAIAEGKEALTQLGLTTERTKTALRTVAVRGGAAALGGMVLAFNHLDESADDATRTLGSFMNIAGSAALGFSVTGGPWGAAIGAAIGLIGAFANAESDAGVDVSGLTETLNQQTGAVTHNTQEWAAKKLQDAGAFGAAKTLGIGLDTVTNAAIGQGDALDTLRSKLRAIIAADTTPSMHTGALAYGENARAAQKLLVIIGATNRGLVTSKRRVEDNNEALGKGADATQKNTTFFGNLVGQINGPLQTSLRNNRDDVDKNADATETYADKVKELDAQLKSISAVLDKRSSIRAYQESLDAINKAIEENGKTLSANTPKGRANADALDAIASNAVSAADAMDNYRKKQQFLAAARQNYIDTAVAMGKNRDAAVKLANSIFGIPDKHTTKPDFDKHDADRDIDDYKKNIDGIPKDPTTKPKFDDGQARGDVNSFVDFFGGALGGIKDEQVKVQLSGLAKLALEGQGPLTRKFGGAIPGFLGTRGKDSVQAMLEPDEHVVTTAEVRAAGKGNAARGHRVWEGIRHAALVGALPDPMDLPAYADGGAAVSPRVGNSGFPSAIHAIEAAFNGVVDRVGEQLSDRINKMYRFGGGAPLGPGGNLSRGQIMMGQRFAQAQNGKPYIWGGVGPTGYDCSGYQSAIVNAALGRNPYQRIGSTSSMPWPGMMGGTGLYTIGWFTGDPGHTSGNIGGLGVESTGDHVRTGSAARSPLDSMFNHVGHYDTGGIWPNNTLGLNTSGGDEFVVNPRRFAEGGKVTKSERAANREERQARRDERAKQARQDASAFAHALKQFDFSHVEKMGRDDVRSEMRDLRTALKDIFGKDAPILKTFDRLEHRMDKQARQQAKLVKSEESLSESLKSLKDKRDQYAASVAGTFRNDIFGGGLDDLSLQLRADTNDAKAMRRALKLAEHKGLSGGLYSGLAASGNMLLAQQFAHLSRAQITRYEHLYAARQGATGALGRTAGAEVYGQRIHENSRALGRVHHRLGENTRQMRKLGRTIERKVARADSGAHKRARTG